MKLARSKFRSLPSVSFVCVDQSIRLANLSLTEAPSCIDGIRVHGALLDSPAGENDPCVRPAVLRRASVAIVAKSERLAWSMGGKRARRPADEGARWQ